MAWLYIQHYVYQVNLPSNHLLEATLIIRVLSLQGVWVPRDDAVDSDYLYKQIQNDISKSYALFSDW